MINKKTTICLGILVCFAIATSLVSATNYYNYVYNGTTWVPMLSDADGQQKFWIEMKNCSFGNVQENLVVAKNFTVDTNTIHIDSTNNRVGIGTASPSGLLNVGRSAGTNEVNLSGVMYVNSTSGNVGIGTTVPFSKLDIDDGIGGFNRLPIRVGSAELSTIGRWTGIGIGYRNAANDGKYTKSAIIFEARDSSYARGKLHFALDSAADDGSVDLTDSKVTIDQNGNVGIGTTAPDHDLEIGTGTYSEIDAGEATFTTGSSRTYKENINPVFVDNILDKISKIPVNTYDFRQEYCNSTDNSDDKCKNKIGLIAEDFHTIFERGSDKELSGDEVRMALWLAVQELNIGMNEKDTEIQELKNQIKELRNLINSLLQTNFP